MSRTVDERVVSMQFDNRQFEDGIQTSLRSIDKLNESLKFEGIDKGLSDINAAVNDVNMNGLAEGVETVRLRFSALQIVAIETLRRITNHAIDAGENMVRSLTLDQFSAGWDKYGEKTRSVQTIMAATAKDFEDTGEQMDYVNDQLDKLNWFTDETSYNVSAKC